MKCDVKYHTSSSISIRPNHAARRSIRDDMFRRGRGSSSLELPLTTAVGFFFRRQHR